MTQAEYLNKVLSMVEKSLEPQEFCGLCDEASAELTDIEFRNRDISVCAKCFNNLPDEYPEDEDQFRGDR